MTVKKDKEIYSSSELKMIKDIEAGKYKSLPEREAVKEKEMLEIAAKNTLKRKSINIRVFEQDIDKIKAIAMSEGMPYQTFITSLIHKVAAGKPINFSSLPQNPN